MQHRRTTLILSSVLLLPLMIHAQVTLQPWVERFGNTNGEQLGKYVAGITPSANLPHRAAISKVGSTGIYQLQDSTQTTPQRIFLGENLLTGDLNNDGFKDVVVGKTVNGYDTVFIYWGTVSGIDTLNPLKIPSENQNDTFKPGCIDDINNDGYADLTCIAPAYPNQLGYGKVYFYLGPMISAVATDTLVGSGVLDRLGGGCALGDLNNDGFSDLILRGSHNPPTGSSYSYVNIYWGVGIDTLHLALGLQMRTDVAANPGLACFDANGDAKDDLLWAIQDSQATRINVHFGRTAFDTIPDLQLQNPGVGTFGSVIINGGDMNGDGYNDIVVGCPRSSITSGSVLVYGGGPSIDRFVDAARSFGSESGFGTSVSGLGDINGDGFADIIVGAPHDPFFNDRGYWGIFKGDSTIRVTSVAEPQTVPLLFILEQAYPNPFNPLTTIQYELRARAHVTLKVYSLLGEEVRTLVNQEQDAGAYTLRFDGKGLSAGTYFYEINVNTADGKNQRSVKKMILLAEEEQQRQKEMKLELLTRARAGDMAAAEAMHRIHRAETPAWLHPFMEQPEQYRQMIPDSAMDDWLRRNLTIKATQAEERSKP